MPDITALIKQPLFSGCKTYNGYSEKGVTAMIKDIDKNDIQQCVKVIRKRVIIETIIVFVNFNERSLLNR